MYAHQGTGRDEIAATERLRQRDPRAIALIYDTYGRQTFSIILRMVRDIEVAEDLTQETFLRVWTRSGTFDSDRGALGAWVMTIARNQALDHLRSLTERARSNSSEYLDAEDPRSFADLERSVQTGSGNHKPLSKALGKLSENHRMVIDLAYFEGCTQTEIAERTGYPLGTVKTWVRGALRIMRQEMTSQDNTSQDMTGEPLIPAQTDFSSFPA